MDIKCETLLNSELEKKKLIETLIEYSKENDFLFNIILINLYDELINKLQNG